MPELTRLISSTALAAMLALPLSAAEHTDATDESADAAPTEVATTTDLDASTVLVIVNGEEIRLGHVLTAMSNLPEQYRSLDDQTLYDGILAQLVQQFALSQNFNEKLPPRLVYALENQRTMLVAAEVLQTALSEAVTEEDIRAAYDSQFGDIDAEEEFNASHILVETEEEARALIQQLEEGQPFEFLAQENSTGPSGPNGGALGWFGSGMMVPPFEAAVIALEEGEVSDPVQTQFGWHVIRLNGTRKVDVPTYEEMRPELEEGLQREAAQALIAGYADTAEVIEPELDAPIDPSIVHRLDLLD